MYFFILKSIVYTLQMKYISSNVYMELPLVTYTWKIEIYLPQKLSPNTNNIDPRSNHSRKAPRTTGSTATRTSFAPLNDISRPGATRRNEIRSEPGSYLGRLLPATVNRERCQPPVYLHSRALFASIAAPTAGWEPGFRCQAAEFRANSLGWIGEVWM